MQDQGFGHNMSFWVTPEMKQRIKDNCRVRTASAWIRSVIRAELDRLDELKALTGEITNIINEAATE